MNKEEEKRDLEAKEQEEKHLNIVEEDKDSVSKKSKKPWIIVISVLVVLAIIFFLYIQPKVIKPMQDYNYAMSLIEEGEYTEAIKVFKKLGDYKDSVQQINFCDYNNALKLLETGKIADAKTIFEKLGDYEDSVQQIDNCEVAVGDLHLKNGNFEIALKIYMKYKDNPNVTETKISQAKEGIYNNGVKYFEEGDFAKAKETFGKVEGYSDSKSYIEKCDTEIQKAKEAEERAAREAAEKKAAEEKQKRQILVGTWYAKKIINYLDNDMTDQMGDLSYYYFTFNDDGTGICSMGPKGPVGGKREFTWELQEGGNGAIGIWTLDGDSDIIFYYGDHILMYTNKMHSIMLDMRFFCYR